MSTIVVGYDDTPASQRALDRAVELAKVFGSSLIVTSVAPVPTTPGRAEGAIDPTDSPADHVEELVAARKHLESAGVASEFVPAVGHPADTITQLAEQRSAELIVVGTREIGFLGRLLGQSVSESVVHHAHCDVLIVH